MNDRLKYLLKLMMICLVVWMTTLFLFADEIIFVRSTENNELMLEEIPSKHLANGVYVGTAEGYQGELTAEVSLNEGVIAGIEITEAKDDSEAAQRAMEEVTQVIVDTNTTEVDTVSGATLTSEAVIHAVNNALSGQMPKVLEFEAEDVRPNTTATLALPKDISGTYKGSAEGYNGDVTVEVEVDQGDMTAIDVIEHQESADNITQVFEDVIQAILDANSTKVDTITGATQTSNAVIMAVNDALMSTYLETLPAEAPPVSENPVESSVANTSISDESELDNKEATSTSALKEEKEQDETTNDANQSLESSDEVAESSLSDDSSEAEIESGADESKSDTEVIRVIDMPDGSYKGQAEGYKGELTVIVTVKGGRIAQVEVIDHEESTEIAAEALLEIPEAIATQNRLDIDTVSGATATSQAIVEAVIDALRGQD